MKSKRGCWTCKRRKIGCDKRLPWCNNCIGTGRECLGYGVRLLWPDHHDGRRRQGDRTVHALVGNLSQGSRYYGQTFLNTTFNDVVSSKDDAGRSRSLMLMLKPAVRPMKSLTLNPPIHGQGVHFLSYYERTISTMISTIQVQNGFRVELLPMALLHRDPSATALCNVMMAVSAFHNWGPEAALPFKAKAVRSLMASLSDDNPPGVTETQAAASMMFCVYNVFDEGEGHWHIHLEGAKNMFQKMCSAGGRPSDFLVTWFLYHAVMGCFTKPFHEDCGSLDILGLFECLNLEKTTIVGSLGCSVEVLEAIHVINSMRASTIHSRADPSPTKLIKQRTVVDNKLQILAQNLDPEQEPATTSFRKTFIHATAELYRLAALLYLQRVCPLSTDERTREIYLDQAFHTLEVLDVATCPWPLFIFACESQSDDQRIQILRTVDRMDQARGLGNIFTLRSIIEGFWTQCDLRADSSSASQIKWWEMVNCDTAMPWFI